MVVSLEDRRPGGVRGPKPSPSSGKNRVGSRSLSAAHDPKLVAFPVYPSVGPSNVSRIFSSTVAPTNAFPWRKPDAIHRGYLELGLETDRRLVRANSASASSGCCAFKLNTLPML